MFWSICSFIITQAVLQIAMLQSALPMAEPSSDMSELAPSGEGTAGLFVFLLLSITLSSFSPPHQLLSLSFPSFSEVLIQQILSYTRKHTDKCAHTQTHRNQCTASSLSCKDNSDRILKTKFYFLYLCVYVLVPEM